MLSLSCYQLWLAGSTAGLGDNPLHPDTEGGFRGEEAFSPLFQKIPPLDVRDEIEYVSARFEAVTVMAAMQKPIKKRRQQK